MIEKRSKEIIADIQLSNDTMRRHIDKRDDDPNNQMFDIITFSLYFTVNYVIRVKR